MIAVPASMVTGPIARSDDGVAAGVWASLHHTATLVSLDDADLVACAVGTPETAPDAEAFGVLYERYVQRVFAFALSRLHDRTQAEDVTSQTFLQALQALPRYRQRGVPIRYWLLTIAANAIYGLHRASPVVPARLGGTDVYERDARGGAVVVELPDPAAEAAIAAGEWAEDFRHLLDTLSPAQRTVIELRFCSGLRIAAIAARMGCTVGAVKALQFRAVQQLRRRWEPETGASGAPRPAGVRLAGARRSHANASSMSLPSRGVAVETAVQHGGMSRSAAPCKPDETLYPAVRTAARQTPQDPPQRKGACPGRRLSGVATGWCCLENTATRRYAAACLPGAALRGSA